MQCRAVRQTHKLICYGGVVLLLISHQSATQNEIYFAIGISSLIVKLELDLNAFLCNQGKNI